MGKKHLSGWRKFESRPMSNEQNRVQFTFQFPNQSADCGLSYIKGIRRLGEIAFLGGSDKVSDVTEFHSPKYYILLWQVKENASLHSLARGLACNTKQFNLDKR